MKYGQNVIIAVIYGAEMPEQFKNMIVNIEEELQIKFTSGVTDIVIGNTELAFGTTMPAVVHDWSYE